MPVTSPPQPQRQDLPTRTVIAAKGVDLILVTYTDEDGRQYTQPAILGDKHVHLLDGRLFGLSRAQTPTGDANPWLRDAIFAKVGRKAL